MSAVAIGAGAVRFVWANVGGVVVGCFGGGGELCFDELFDDSVNGGVVSEELLVGLRGGG